MRIRLVALAVVAPMLLGPASAASAVSGASASLPAPPSAHRPCGVLTAPRRYRHVIWIWMENHSYSSIIGSRAAPYVNSLAARCGLATNYHNISHPSLPNYVGATSGLGSSALRKFTPDCDPTASCRTAAPSVFSQGETWKAYEESMPASCDSRNSGEYAVRHNPPPYFSGLPGCSGSDDMHDGTIANGDRWLARNLPAILDSPEYKNGSTAVFVTWAERAGGTARNCATNSADVGCHVVAIVISPSTRTGTRSARCSTTTPCWARPSSCSACPSWAAPPRSRP